MLSRIKCLLIWYVGCCTLTAHAFAMQSQAVDTTVIGVPVKDFSPVMKNVVKLLLSKEDSLGVTVVEGKSQLLFRKYTGQTELTHITEVPNAHYKSVFVQSRQPYKNMYPYYWIAEIGFESETDAGKQLDELSKMISGSDVFNRNTKDYLIKNGANLIYLKIGLEAVEQQAMHVLEMINKQINAGR